MLAIATNMLQNAEPTGLDMQGAQQATSYPKPESPSQIMHYAMLKPNAEHLFINPKAEALKRLGS